MARIRLPLALLATGVGAAAPSFQEVPGTYQPIIPGKVTKDGVMQGILLSDPALAAVTVLVDVPDEDATADHSKLDPQKIAQRYPNHPLVTSGAIK